MGKGVSCATGREPVETVEVRWTQIEFERMDKGDKM